jgi:TatA/E family protein of Tat protein translocase
MKIVLLGLLAMIIFGPKRLPELGRSLGKGIRELREAVGTHSDVHEVVTTVAEVRNAVSPVNLAATFITGAAEVQQTMSSARGALSGEVSGDPPKTETTES